ncbi:MAG TPA: alkene reductase [Psychromonas sp.]
MRKLFTPIQVGNTECQNRIAMAPMTRARVRNEFDAADSDTAIYFSQRASAGLLITEGAPISKQGQGFLYIPGIYSEQQVEAWKETTQAVHDKGGKIFIQIWHVGRMSHTSLQHEKQSPVSCVDTQANGTCFAYDENGQADKVEVSPAHGLTLDEIQAVKQDYIRAAKNAMAAGFDGVEIHAANGYLIEQFINAELNTRDDIYGAQTMENRLRFALEMTGAVCEAIGAEHTGIRISPFGRYGDMKPFEGEEETWLELGHELSKCNLAYVHVNDQDLPEGGTTIPAGFMEKFRDAFAGTLMMAGCFDKAKAQTYLENNLVDMVAFGRPYISNPDLVERMQNDWPLIEPDRQYFYGGDKAGYIDYPTYQEQLAQSNG